jgi:transcriptional regulator with XRE-family HTH domain
MRRMSITEAVAARIRVLLKEKGISLYRLEHNIPMHHGTLADIMNAVNESMNFRTILQICRGFGITPSEFLNDPLFSGDEIDID